VIEALHSFVLPVPPQQAFHYIAQPLSDPEWQNSCQSASLDDPSLAGRPMPVGGRYRITFSFMGRVMSFHCEVTGSDAPDTYAFKVLEGPFIYEGTYRFHADPQGTRVDWRFTTNPGKFFGLIPSSLLRKVLVSQIERDALNLAARLRDAVPAIDDMTQGPR
jgi:hypothetical protein